MCTVCLKLLFEIQNYKKIYQTKLEKLLSLYKTNKMFKIMKRTILMLTGIILFAACCKDDPHNNPCETKTAILPPTGYELNTVGEIDFNGSIRSFQFVNQQVGYVLASNNRGGDVDVFKTTDGGKNWVDLNIIHSQNPVGMMFKDEHLGIITVRDTEGCPDNCKKKCVILKTEDGGLTWVEKELKDLKGSLNHPKYDNKGNLYANLFLLNLIGNSYETKTTLIKSTDDGETWDTFFSSPELDVSRTTYSLEIINDKIFVSAKDNKLLVIDTNGELIKTLEIENRYIYDVELIDENNLIVVTGTDMIKSTNGGETWQSIHQGGARMIGFDSIDKGLILSTKSTCNDFDIIYPDDIISATNNGGFDWDAPEEGATSLRSQFSNGQKMSNGSWYVMIGKKLLEIKEN